MKRIDRMGQRYGRLTVIAPSGNTRDGRARWIARCDCGNEMVAIGYALAGGHTKSCGCLRKICPTRTHGMSESLIYGVWLAMRRRCDSPSSTAYAAYGGRGIRVCERWERFENFLSDMGQPPPGMQLDRIDNDGNYEPGNCRWATISQQVRNRRISIKVTIDGETANLADWCERIGNVHYNTARKRLCTAGWTAAQAVGIDRHPSARVPKLGRP